MNYKLSIPAPSCILTFYRLFLFVFSAVILIASTSLADVVEQYLDDTPTGVSGNDVGVVSNTIGTNPYNIIKISNTDEVTATHNVSVTNIPSSYSAQSALSGQKQTVNAGNASLYNLPASEYQVKFQDLDYQGNQSILSGYGSFMNFENSSKVNITLDNVSYSGFQNNRSGGVFSFPGSSSEINIKTLNTVSFTNNAVNNTSAASNNDYSRGAAIFISDNNLNIDSENIIFQGNSAYKYGAAITGYGTATVGQGSKITITGNNILFDNNTVINNDGGAIMTNGTLIITGKDADSKTVFSNNSAKHMGGALSIQGSVTLSTGSFYFDNNKLNATPSYNRHGGGAIDTNSLFIQNAKEVSFTNNEGIHVSGGAVNIKRQWNSYTGDPSQIEAQTIIFDSNIANDGWGGAIQSRDNLNIEGNSILFKNNKSVTGSSSTGDGGAICGLGNLTFTGSGDNSEITFQGNFATRLGGAISGYYLSMSSFDAIKFINNSSSYGGAFYGYSASFEGDGVTASFIGNTATTQGNDINLINPSSGMSILSFRDNGTYAFDGGIYLDSTTAQTIIDQASVTIMGRENDTTNRYQLQNVTLSNGGKLTANLDNINYLSGSVTIDADNADSVITLTANGRSATMKSSSGEGAELSLFYEAAGQVESQNCVVSSGRLDIKGYMEGSVQVESDATFSPGNSVGTADIGDFTLTGALLMEVDGTGADILICDEFSMNSGAVKLQWQNDEIPYFSTIDIIISESLSDLSGVYENLVDNIDFSTSPTAEQLYNAGYITVSLVGANNNIVRLSIDRNAVPEPSTWALLILGAAGLMYMRKNAQKRA